MAFKYSNTLIVYMDDNSEQRKEITGYFRKIGFTYVTPAKNYKNLQELVQKLHPSLILMAEMKDTSGYDICREMKPEEGGIKVPIIGIGEIRYGWSEASADDSIRKIELQLAIHDAEKREDLVARIRKHVERYKEMRKQNLDAY